MAPRKKPVVNDKRDTTRLANETSITTESDTTDPEADATKAKREAEEKKLATLRGQLKVSLSAYGHFRENAKKDSQFRAGTWGKKSFQWDPAIQAEREEDGRPCLTINRAPGFVHQITNSIRNAHLTIQINPENDKGDPKVAEVLQSIIRNITINSQFEALIGRASDKQAEIGLSFLSAMTEWKTDDPDAPEDEVFQQRIRYFVRRNPLSIMLDPGYQLPDAADANFAIEFEDYDLFQFEERFGVKGPDQAAIDAFADTGAEVGDWFPSGKIRVVNWFNRELSDTKVKRALLSDGRVVLAPATEEERKTLLATGVKIVQERTLQKKKTMHRRCTALSILEETEFPADRQPYIPIVGDELEIDGERDWRGCLRDSQHAGIVYNVEVSGLVEAVGRGIKAPVVGYKGQFGADGSEQRNAWAKANKKPIAFLEIDPVDIDGKPAPFPQPITWEPPIQGVVMAIHQADTDYKSTAGFHDASLGQRGPQESGRAIVARQRQDELGSSHYTDNFRGGLSSLGRLTIQLIRSTIDVPQVLRITGNDERERNVMAFTGAHNDPRNEEFLKTHPAGAAPITLPDGKTIIMPGQKVPFQLPDGVEDIYDLGVGEYRVECSAAPDPGTRRQESVEAITTLFKGLPPELSSKFLDLYFTVMDFPMARQMAERAKKLMPPELQDDAGGGGKPQIPPQVVAQMEQMKQAMDQMQQLLGEAKSGIAKERMKLQSNLLLKREELDSRERIEKLRIQASLLQQRIDLKAEEAMTLLNAEIERLSLSGQQRFEAGLKLLESHEAHKDRQHDIDSTLLEAALVPEPVAPPAAAAPEPVPPAAPVVPQEPVIVDPAAVAPAADTGGTA